MLASFETRHLGWVLGGDNLFERSWSGSTHRQPTPHLLRMFRAPQSSSASRFTAGTSGFLNFSQAGNQSDRYLCLHLNSATRKKRISVMAITYGNRCILLGLRDFVLRAGVGLHCLRPLNLSAFV